MRIVPVFICLLTLMACTSKPQEERVLEWVAQAIELAEQGDASGLLDMTASDFRIKPHSMDRRALKLRLAMALRRFRKGSIHYPSPSVTLSGQDDLAEVSFPFLTVRGAPPAQAAGTGDADSWLEGLANKTGVMRIHLNLRLEDDDWLATQGRLERFNGVSFSPVR